MIETNGWIRFSGGFHLRGLCDSPGWHSLLAAWRGAKALHLLFDNIRPTDLPFGQDCFGDQYLLRDGQVIHLHSETGEVDAMRIDFSEFLRQLCANPEALLNLPNWFNYLNSNGTLSPGQLLRESLNKFPYSSL